MSGSNTLEGRITYFWANFIATSAEVTPNGGLVRESSPQNPLNSGLGIPEPPFGTQKCVPRSFCSFPSFLFVSKFLGIIVICPDILPFPGKFKPENHRLNVPKGPVGGKNGPRDPWSFNGFKVDFQVEWYGLNAADGLFPTKSNLKGLIFLEGCMGRSPFVKHNFRRGGFVYHLGPLGKCLSGFFFFKTAFACRQDGEISMVWNTRL